jgi:hypothetical protein
MSLPWVRSHPKLPSVGQRAFSVVIGRRHAVCETSCQILGCTAGLGYNIPRGGRAIRSRGARGSRNMRHQGKVYPTVVRSTTRAYLDVGVCVDGDAPEPVSPITSSNVNACCLGTYLDKQVKGLVSRIHDARLDSSLVLREAEVRHGLSGEPGSARVGCCQLREKYELGG